MHGGGGAPDRTATLGAPTDEYVVRRPAAALRPWVASYHAYRQDGLPPGLHRGLPSPYLTLIVTLDDPIEIAAHPDPRQGPGEFATVVGGLHVAPALIRHPGRQSGIQVAVAPTAARALLGLPAGELAHIDVEAEDVLGSRAAELRERVLAAPGWPARLAVLDEMLSAHARPGAEPPAEVDRAWRRLLATGGTVDVAGLARDVGWTPRHLNTRFRVEIGLSPKEAARVVRFDRARRLLQQRVGRGRPPGLADLAATCGYYDQAHLARDFRALAGCPPSRWIAEELRFVQVATAAAQEDWAA